MGKDYLPEESGEMENEEGEAMEGEENEDTGNEEDKSKSPLKKVPQINKGRSRLRRPISKPFKLNRPRPSYLPNLPRDPCDKKVEAILKKVMKKLEMSQLIENKALRMVTEMMDEHGYDMDDEDDGDYDEKLDDEFYIRNHNDGDVKRKGFGSAVTYEAEDDMADEAMDSETYDEADEATTDDPSDVNDEEPDDEPTTEPSSDPVEAATEINEESSPDEYIDEDDMSETGGSAEMMEDYENMMSENYEEPEE